MELEGTALLSLLTSNDEKKRLLGLVTLRKNAANNGSSSLAIMMPLIVQRFIAAPITNSAAKRGALLSRKIAYLLIPVNPVYGSAWVTVANAVDRDLQLANNAGEANPALGELGVFALRAVLGLPYPHIEEYVRSRWEVIVLMASQSRNNTLRLTALDAIMLVVNPPLGLERHEQEVIVHRIASKPHFAEVLRRLLLDSEATVVVKSFELLSVLQLAGNAAHLGASLTIVGPMPNWLLSELGLSPEVCQEILHRASRLSLKQQQSIQHSLLAMCLAVVRAHPSLVSILLSLSDSILASSLHSDWNAAVVINAAIALLSIVTHQKSLLLSLFPHLTLCVDKVLGVIQKHIATLADSARVTKLAQERLPASVVRDAGAPPIAHVAPFPGSVFEVLQSMIMLMPAPQRLRFAMSLINSCFAARTLQNPKLCSVDHRPLGFHQDLEIHKFFSSVLALVSTIMSHAVNEVVEETPGPMSVSPAATKGQLLKNQRAGKLPPASTHRLSPLISRLVTQLNCTPTPTFALFVLDHLTLSLASDLHNRVAKLLQLFQAGNPFASNTPPTPETATASAQFVEQQQIGLQKLLNHVEHVHVILHDIFFGLVTTPEMLTTTTGFLTIMETSACFFFADVPDFFTELDDTLLSSLRRARMSFEKTIVACEGTLPYLAMRQTTNRLGQSATMNVSPSADKTSAAGGGSALADTEGAEESSASDAECYNEGKLYELLELVAKLSYLRCCAPAKVPRGSGPRGNTDMVFWAVAGRGALNPHPAMRPEFASPSGLLCNAAVSATSSILRCEKPVASSLTSSSAPRKISDGGLQAAVAEKGEKNQLAPSSSAVMSFLSRADQESRFSRCVGIITLLYGASVASGCLESDADHNTIVHFVHGELLPTWNHSAEQPYVRKFEKIYQLLKGAMTTMEQFAFGSAERGPVSLREMVRCYFSALSSPASWKSLLFGARPLFVASAARWSDGNRSIPRQVCSNVVSREGDPLKVTLSYVLVPGQTTAPLEVTATLANTTSQVLQQIAFSFSSCSWLVRPQKKRNGLSHGLSFKAEVSHTPKRSLFATTSQTDVAAPSSSSHVAYRGGGTFLVSTLAPKAFVSLTVAYTVHATVLGECRIGPTLAVLERPIGISDAAKTTSSATVTAALERVGTHRGVTAQSTSDYQCVTAGPSSTQGAIAFRCHISVAAHRCGAAATLLQGDTDDLFAIAAQGESSSGGGAEDDEDEEDDEIDSTAMGDKRHMKGLLAQSPQLSELSLALAHFFRPLPTSGLEQSTGLSLRHGTQSIAAAVARALFGDQAPPMAPSSSSCVAGQLLPDTGLSVTHGFCVSLTANAIDEAARRHGWELHGRPECGSVVPMSAELRAEGQGTLVSVESEGKVQGYNAFVSSVPLDWLSGGTAAGTRRASGSVGVGVDDASVALFACRLAPEPTAPHSRASPDSQPEPYLLHCVCSHAAAWFLPLLIHHPEFDLWALSMAYSLIVHGSKA